MRRSALIAFCIAALSMLVAPASRADPCSELVTEYNEGRLRQEEQGRTLGENLLNGYRPSGAEWCAYVRVELLESRRELAVVQRFFPDCAGQLPRLPSGKVCEIACREKLVSGAQAVAKEICKER